MVAILSLSACTNGGDISQTSSTSSTTPAPSTDPNTPSSNPTVPNPTQPGVWTAQPIGVHLSSGKPQQLPQLPNVVPGEPLTDPEIKEILDRLPAWEPADYLSKDFRWPVQTIKAPPAGNVIDVPFPAEPTGPKIPVPDKKPLKVSRFQPEGRVSLAPFISITFNQPMVPIGTVGQLDALDVPVTISPELPGTWQWLGTSTLRFDAAAADYDRLPMATEYTVTIPAGTAAASGAELAEEVSFSFDTPPVTVKSLQPTGKGLELSPVFLAIFDQMIDQQSILDLVTLTADGHSVTIRLATDAEVAADERINDAVSKLPGGRWVAFTAESELPTDAQIDISFAAGLPSAEGPLTTSKVRNFSAHTYAPLKITGSSCDDQACRPGADLRLKFNNRIDLELFDPSTLTVSPETPGVRVYADANYLVISGATSGSTTYTVTIPAALTDVFGQTLGEANTREFTFGKAEPQLFEFPGSLITLDPHADQPVLNVHTVNRTEYRERIFAVTPADWGSFQGFQRALSMSGYDGKPKPNVPDWTEVSNQIINVVDTADQEVQTPINLSAHLTLVDGQYRGHLVVLIESTGADKISGNAKYLNRDRLAWVQATGIGLDALGDSGSLVTWTTDLLDGAPLADVTVSGVGGTQVATSDVDGLATTALGSSGFSAIVATLGVDTAILPSDQWGNRWTKLSTKDQTRWYINDDRQTYRPGETVSIKGWVRTLNLTGDGQLIQAASNGVKYRARDGYGNEIASGTAELSTLGGFDLTIELPDGAALGTGSVEFTRNYFDSEDGAYHQFQIADFRRPDFEVLARPESTGPYVIGEDLTVAVDANYYAGGPLGAAQVDWQVQTASANYAPPGWQQYNFGKWTPWWPEPYLRSSFSFSVGRFNDYCCERTTPATVDEFSGVTDRDGSNYLQVQVGDLGADFTGLPVTVTTQASVTDINRQQIAGQTSILVHPADFYVGLKSAATYVRAGEPLVVDTIVTDIDGKAVAGRTVQVTVSLTSQQWINGNWSEVETDSQTCTVVSAAEAVSCSVQPTSGGRYQISATVIDDSGRGSISELTRWVGGAVTAPDRSVRQQELTLIPGQAQYAPGDTAQIMVQAPFATGSGILVLSRQNIVGTERFSIVDGTAVVEIPIRESDIPGLSVWVEAVGNTPRDIDDPEQGIRSAYAVGQLDLDISTDSKQLQVSITPQDPVVKPGSQTSVDVLVTDQAGNPMAGSEFEIMVVDEAVLALSGQELANPIDIFYAPVETYLDSKLGRSSIILTDPMVPVGWDSGQARELSMAGAYPLLEDFAYTTGSAAGGAPTAAQAIPVRQNFDALAVFKPTVITDADGKATIDVPVPDSLTRYRIRVVAVAEADQFGLAEANLTAQLPLTVRPSAPRFLNFGDTAELPVLVQNLGSEPMVVEVVIQATNLDILDGSGQRVTVPANDRVEVRFPVAAAQAGTARFRVAVTGGNEMDAFTLEMPVYTPATSEAVATYGVVDSGAVVNQPYLSPTEVFEQFGGMDITTSSTALQALTDAVDYLIEYRYDSTDALAAQILAIASLSDVLAAFDSPGLPSPEKLRARVAENIEKLVALQNVNGGFPDWRLEQKTSAFNSIQVTQALLAADQRGFDVPDQTLNRAKSYLSKIESRIPAKASQRTKDTIRSYALNVLMQAGQRDTGKAERIFTERGDALSLDALVWLWPVVADPAQRTEIARRIQNSAVETAGKVTFSSSAKDDAWVTLQSDRRTDGLILRALLEIEPDNELIPKIVSGLLGAQHNGRWRNVQENAFILLALREYFDEAENVTPDFVARVWLGERFAGEHDYRGYSTDSTLMEIPTAEIIGSDSSVTISNDGTGRLYYRIGLVTAPTDLTLDPLDRGFVVTRTYEAIDDPQDVTQTADGTWNIKAGARVRVHLTLVAQSTRTHVALIDPLAAGLEILNPNLATSTKDLPGKKGDEAQDDVEISQMSWYGSWFDHQNLADDRAEAFSSWLSAGVYDYTYTARATTVGTFIAPPPRAEEIYNPETFGRGSTDRVVIG